jgi:hypothetical protein
MVENWKREVERGKEKQLIDRECENGGKLEKRSR